MMTVVFLLPGHRLYTCTRTAICHPAVFRSCMVSGSMEGVLRDSNATSTLFVVGDTPYEFYQAD